MGRFLKPLTSKIREQNGESLCYYLVKVGNYSRTMKKYGLGYLCFGSMDYSQCGSSPFFTKAQIDQFPKYMRRGGIYGHDDVKAVNLSSKEKLLCKFYNLNILRK